MFPTRHLFPLTEYKHITGNLAVKHVHIKLLYISNSNFTSSPINNHLSIQVKNPVLMSGLDNTKVINDVKSRALKIRVHDANTAFSLRRLVKEANDKWECYSRAFAADNRKKILLYVSKDCPRYYLEERPAIEQLIGMSLGKYVETTSLWIERPPQWLGPSTKKTAIHLTTTIAGHLALEAVKKDKRSINVVCAAIALHIPAVEDPVTETQEQLKGMNCEETPSSSRPGARGVISPMIPPTTPPYVNAPCLD